MLSLIWPSKSTMERKIWTIESKAFRVLHTLNNNHECDEWPGVYEVLLNGNRLWLRPDITDISPKIQGRRATAIVLDDLSDVTKLVEQDMKVLGEWALQATGDTDDSLDEEVPMGVPDRKQIESPSEEPIPEVVTRTPVDKGTSPSTLPFIDIKTR